MANWTEEEIMEQIKASENASKSAKLNVAASEDGPAKVSEIDQSATVRHLMVIGCGDGGSMIASQIRKSIPDTYCICYNTSPGVLDKLNVDLSVVPTEKDGAGKERTYSKEVFKQGSYKGLIGNVSAVLQKRPDIAYIIVCSTADGGTGSGISPMLAKLLSDNVSRANVKTDDDYGVPVILLGVYPDSTEDATAQYNTMMWQEEVSKIGVPYILFDNSKTGCLGKTMIHNKVNQTIVNSLRVITGDIYSNSSIQSIDSRDIWMMLENTGDRIVITTSEQRPLTGQSLDDYINDMLNISLQPLPSGARAMGVFLKGPMELIKNLDTSLSEIQTRYGKVKVKYVHIEDSKDIQISIILSGCSEPEDRLLEIKSRYEDIMRAQSANRFSVSSLLDGIEKPMENKTHKKTNNPTSDVDLSALDI